MTSWILGLGLIAWIVGYWIWLAVHVVKTRRTAAPVKGRPFDAR